MKKIVAVIAIAAMLLVTFCSCENTYNSPVYGLPTEEERHFTEGIQGQWQSEPEHIIFFEFGEDGTGIKKVFENESTEAAADKIKTTAFVYKIHGNIVIISNGTSIDEYYIKKLPKDCMSLELTDEYGTTVSYQRVFTDDTTVIKG